MSTPAPRWKPSVTVAAIVEHEGRFLVVEEETSEGLRLNNPAGHLELGESLAQAVVREVLEETACAFTPSGLLGIYLSRFKRRIEAAGRPAGGDDVTYLRFAFRGTVGAPLPGRALDDGIVRTLWLTPGELRARAARHRSPLVLRCMEDHLAGRAYPLELLQADASLLQPWTLG